MARPGRSRRGRGLLSATPNLPPHTWQLERFQRPRPEGLPEIPPGPPLVVILSGPSGAGKDSVRDLLIAWRVPLHYVVTATTRERRPGEVEDVDYHFLSKAEWQRLVDEDGFIEREVVYGQNKGVPKSEVIEPLRAGRDVFARVDIQGARTLKAAFPDALMIFLMPPSLSEAGRRLTERDTETPVERDERIAAAAAEVEAAREFDHVVLNETGALVNAATRVIEIIASEKRRRAG